MCLKIKRKLNGVWKIMPDSKVKIILNSEYDLGFQDACFSKSKFFYLLSNDKERKNRKY